MTGSAAGRESARPAARISGFRRRSGPATRAGRLPTVRSSVDRVYRDPASLLRAARSAWRSSLQLRVVGTTLVTSAAVVSLLGFFLMQQLTANQLRKAEADAYTQAHDGLRIALSQPNISVLPGPSASQFLYGLVSSLRPSANTPADEYGLAVGVTRPGPPAYISFSSYDLATGYLPGDVKEYVATHRQGAALFEFARMPYPTDGGPSTAGLLYAAPFGSEYALYYFFPLTALQAELSVVLRTLALVGLALVFLLAGIAWLVTRWVVVPVAKAAQGAKLLSTGNLDERLGVRGNDEVAALATAFNEMAASLQDKMRELEGLSQVQRQFVSDVSHELRTPLTTIRMASDLLFEGRERLDTQARRSAELLQSQLERFEVLLADLLEISRYDANVATLDAELVDICDLVRNSADVAQQLAERRGARIEFRLPAEPCVAEVDRRRVERILRNLLVNAVEHGEGRDVVVTSAADRGAVAVAVRDYGVGLAPGEEILVFDRFWRADPARARTSGGTGLGLAIALEDARLHGGWLEAWGSPGQGSIFRLTLPRSVGSELAGSPLPLKPDLADLDGLIGYRRGEPATGELPGAGPLTRGQDRW